MNLYECSNPRGFPRKLYFQEFLEQYLGTSKRNILKETLWKQFEDLLQKLQELMWDFLKKNLTTNVVKITGIYFSRFQLESLKNNGAFGRRIAAKKLLWKLQEIILRKLLRNIFGGISVQLLQFQILWYQTYENLKVLCPTF